MNTKNHKIAVIGLGYVGLPLAVAFAEKYSVVGFDINKERIDSLSDGNDSTLEIEKSQLLNVLVKESNDPQNKGLLLTNEKDFLKEIDTFIITVPTPVDKYNRPDLTPMIKASEMVAAYLKKGNIVIYESTVYPGVTEEEMVPILEKNSGLGFNKDFFCGYSPERINPGDKLHTVTQILKITSGSTPEIAEKVDALYKSIIVAGTHKASSIKVAEAAKVIENAQRDINIAFVNELAKIFSLLRIDTQDVLNAAGTKWNFLKFQPGLVGGHCIGVDPYYLAQKAQEVGYHPDIILAGRRINDSMGKYVAAETVKTMLKKNIQVYGSKVLILGFAFKENCPDFRNTKVTDIYNELKSFGIDVHVHDQCVDQEAVHVEYGIKISQISKDNFDVYSAVILAVAHDEYKLWNFERLDNRVIFDVKGVLPRDLVDGRL